MTTNIVTAKFCNSRKTTTRPLTQYDYGQILHIEGIDLPDAYEVDFSNNQYTGDSKPQLGDASGVSIPEEYIKTGKDIYAFIYLHAGEDDGETFYWIKIPNQLRPARTEETPTPEEQSIIDQTIAALNTGVQKVEDIADGLEEQIDIALQEAKDSGEFDGEDGFSPEITVEDITGGHRVTVVDKDGTETFDVMDGEDGDTGRGIVTIEKTSTSGLVDTYTITYSDNTTGTFYVTNGENGDPGTPGFSPVVAISSITGGHRVTITSATGTDSFDVLDGVDGEDGNGIASVELNDDYTLTLIFDDSTSYTTTSIRGEPGEDGYSPVASVSKVGKVATITITDKTHTTTATVSDGEDGDPGLSPTVTVTDITGGHRVTITDADGAHSFDVMDGDVADAPVQSVNGKTGVVVLNATDVGAGTYSKPSGGIPASDLAAAVQTSLGKADTALQSAPVQSVNGQTGAVVLDAQDIGAYEKPVTGIPKTDLESAVQVSLGKADTALQSAPVTSVNTKTGAVVLTPSDIGAASPADVAAKYTKPSGGIPASDLAAGVIPTVPVQDVQVNGTSILDAQGVANVPVASANASGVVQVTGSNSGIGLIQEFINGQLITTPKIAIISASNAQIKNSNGSFNPITPDKNDRAVFYGLAKTAGDTTQSASSNPVGTYTDEAKAAIQQMLDVPSTSDIPEVPVQDVQVNGVSVLNDGVANVPLASSDQFGAIKLGDTLSKNAANRVNAKTASSGVVKLGTASGSFITPEHQHESTFYGLAKAAGADMASSSNTVGNYTDAAKVAIQKMLGIYEAPWELIREDTFTNATEADHIITADSNGQAFELTDVVLQFETPKQDTSSGNGSYGQIWFYYGETSYYAVECGAWTQAAGAAAHGVSAVVENHGGMMFIGATAQTTSTNSSSYRYRYYEGLNEYSSQGIFMASANRFFSKFNIKTVTGTGHYKLYGKRKWT